MTGPLCHDLSTIDTLMLAVLPSRKLNSFHVFSRVNWTLSEIGIYFPDYQYLKGIYFKFFWYLFGIY